MNKTICPGILMLSILIALPSFSAPLNIQTSGSGNTYISGQQVKFAVPVPGDLFVAGGRVNVASVVGADAALAGGTVEVRATIKEDLRVAAGSIDIDASIGGELLAAGGEIELAPAALIAGSAWIAGSDVLLAGKIGKGLKVVGSKVSISGEIDGDTQIVGRDIKLLAGTKINGNLSYASPNPLFRDPSVQISGSVTQEKFPEQWNKAQEGRRALAWFHPVFVLSMIATGMLLFLLAPQALRNAQSAIREFPLRSLLTGVALLFAVPPAAILFMITVIGIPIGFMLLMLYPLMLLLAYLLAAFYIGRQIADAMQQPQQLSLGRQALFLALALLIMNLIVLIPFAGAILILMLLLIGIGGWAVSIYMQGGPKKSNSLPA